MTDQGERTAIVIPQTGTESECELLELYVDVGARVEAGDVLGLAESEKVQLEVSAPVTGVLDELLYGPGDEVPLAQPIGYVRSTS